MPAPAFLQASFRRSQVVRDRQRLEALPAPPLPPKAGAQSGHSRAATLSDLHSRVTSYLFGAFVLLRTHRRWCCLPCTGAGAVQRVPKRYRELDADGMEMTPPTAAGPDASVAARQAQQQAAQVPAAEQQLAGGVGELREHFPPASSAPDTFTLLKFYSLTSAVRDGFVSVCVCHVSRKLTLTPQCCREWAAACVGPQVQQQLDLPIAVLCAHGS